jgi:hypothetical protein
MDDNRTQATSAYRSINKHVSGCDRKRDSSFLAFGISPSKLISDMAFAGYCLLPGAATHKENKKDRGGEKKESSCHHGHIDHSIAYYPKLLTVNISPGGFTGSFSSAPPCLFNSEFENPVLRRCI